MPQVKRMEVNEAFRQWITSRKDLDAYRGKKSYPVYIVAAEGGGLYAAYHTAKVLARLQDMCENFAQHVFAVTRSRAAVSGPRCLRRSPKRAGLATASTNVAMKATRRPSRMDSKSMPRRCWRRICRHSRGQVCFPILRSASCRCAYTHSIAPLRWRRASRPLGGASGAIRISSPIRSLLCAARDRRNVRGGCRLACIAPQCH